MRLNKRKKMMIDRRDGSNLAFARARGGARSSEERRRRRRRSRRRRRLCCCWWWWRLEDVRTVRGCSCWRSSSSNRRRLWPRTAWSRRRRRKRRETSSDRAVVLAECDSGGIGVRTSRGECVTRWEEERKWRKVETETSKGRRWEPHG